MLITLGQAEFLVCLFPVGIALVIAVWVWHHGRSSDMLEQWAAANGYVLLERERRAFFRGPFFWTTGKGQEVFYVTLRDSDGVTRRAWVRVGGMFLGLMSDNVDVRWDG